MSRAEVLFRNLAFGYEEAATVLFSGLTFHFPTGWTGIVGANGAGKTTILKLATGELTPDEGQVQAPDGAIYCPQRTDAPPIGLEELLGASEGEAQSIKGRLGIEADWPARWQTLSHGERKRAQVGVALWRRPPVLAIDEPTNHLDLPSIECLEEALKDCPCGLLLVSHDVRFLERLNLHALADTRRRGCAREGRNGAGCHRRMGLRSAPRREKRDMRSTVSAR